MLVHVTQDLLDDHLETVKASNPDANRILGNFQAPSGIDGLYGGENKPHSTRLKVRQQSRTVNFQADLRNEARLKPYFLKSRWKLRRSLRSEERRVGKE